MQAINITLTDKPQDTKHIEMLTQPDNIVTADTSSNVNISITRSSWWENKKVIGIAILINMASFEYGLDQGMVNGFQAMPGFLQVFGYEDPSLPGGFGISTTVQQLITSLVALGMFLATLVTGYIAGTIGRKGAIWLGCVTVFLSLCLQMSGTSIGTIYAGRLFLGIANGLLVVGSQLYMQEIIPSNLRSLNFTLFQFWIGFGALIGAIVNNYTSTRFDRSSYRIPLGVLFVVPAFLCVALFFVPESPRLYATRGHRTMAYKALRQVRDSSFTDVQVEEEIEEIMCAIGVDIEMSEGIGFLDIFRRQNIKRTVASVGAACFAAASGSPFITQYGVYFFLLSGDDKPFRDVIILLGLGMAAALCTPLFTGKVGKRPIFMFGATLQALCMLGIALAYTISGTTPIGGRTIIAMTCLYLFVYCATISPFGWQVAGEIPSQPLRAHTLGFGSSLTFLLGWVLTFTVPYFINPTSLNWGAKYGYIWVPSNLLIAIFVYFLIPETNKRTLEEIDECYSEGVPVRKFATHDCVASKQARQDAVLRFQK